MLDSKPLTDSSYSSPRSVGYPQTKPQGTSSVTLAAIRYHSLGRMPQSFRYTLESPGIGRCESLFDCCSSSFSRAFRLRDKRRDDLLDSMVFNLGKASWLLALPPSAFRRVASCHTVLHTMVSLLATLTERKSRAVTSGSPSRTQIQKARTNWQNAVRQCDNCSLYSPTHSQS
jgi:hypothetical protein